MTLIRLGSSRGQARGRVQQSRGGWRTLLNNDVNPKRVFTISFTRATTAELSGRIIAFCTTQPCADVAADVSVSTSQFH